MDNFIKGTIIGDSLKTTPTSNLSNENLSKYLLQDVPAYKNVTEELEKVSRKYDTFFFSVFLMIT